MQETGQTQMEDIKTNTVPIINTIRLPIFVASTENAELFLGPQLQQELQKLPQNEPIALPMQPELTGRKMRNYNERTWNGGIKNFQYTCKLNESRKTTIIFFLFWFSGQTLFWHLPVDRLLFLLLFIDHTYVLFEFS